jgi:hypothetical protein
MLYQMDGIAVKFSFGQFWYAAIRATGLSTASQKLACCCRYVSDIFAAWPHSREELGKFQIYSAASTQTFSS